MSMVVWLLILKLTSWNPSTNNYAQSYGSRETSGKITHQGAPRPFIRIESGSTGTTNITNSEIAYLGYEEGWGFGTSGIHYHNGGDGSIIKNNKIHNLYLRDYSVSINFSCSYHNIRNYVFWYTVFKEFSESRTFE